MEERKLWAEEFANVDIISSTSGAMVKLGDIARITDGFEESGFHGQFNQQNTAIILVIVPCLYMILEDVATNTKKKVRELVVEKV